MKRLFLFLFILSISSFSIAQNCKSFPVASWNSDLTKITKQYQQIIEQQMGGNDTILPSNFWDSLYVLVGKAEASGNTQKAIEIRKHIAEKYKEQYGETHSKYANELTNIGLTYQMIQDYQNAISYWEKGDSIYHLLNDTLESMQARYFLGTIYKEVQNLPKAILYYKQYVQLYKATHRDLDVLLFKMDTLIGNLYLKLGDKYNALLHWENACEIRLQLHGYRHRTYIKEIEAFANAYDNLAETEYLENRNYIVALECMKHSADICKRIYGEKSTPYAVRLSNIGHIFSTIGNSSKAIEYYQQGLNIAKGNHCSTSKRDLYTTSLCNTGLEYGKLGDYQKAINYLESGLKTAQKIHNQSRNKHILLVLNNLSVVYANMGDYDKAQDYMKECLALIERIDGKQSSLYKFMQKNLGSLYATKGDYQAAISILSKSMGITRALVGEEDIEYASLVLDLGHVYYCNQQYRMATNYISYAANIYMQDVIRTFSTMTEEDRRLYWSQISKFLSPAYASNYRYSTDSTLSTLYKFTLFSKGLLLSSSIEFSKVIAESGDQKAISNYKELLSLREKINKQKQLPASMRAINIEDMEHKVEQLERKLVSISKEFGDFTQYLKLGWRDVQAALSDREVAVEFVDFPLDLTNSGDSIIYAALVIRKGWTAPKMIPLFEEKELKMFSDNIQTSNKNSINKFYNNPAIYNIIWGPLENENVIHEGDTIYFSASGLLHKLGIEYIPHRLGKNVTIHRLSSTKQLCTDSPKLSYNNAVLYGGLKYDTDDQTKITESNKAYSKGYNASGLDSKLIADITRSCDNNPWNELQGTSQELDSICQLYANHGLQYDVYSGNSGVEETFKMLSGRNTPLLFIATHGFFISEDLMKENKFMGKMMDIGGGDNTSAKPDLTMQRSGLVLSGGNAAWMGEPIPEGVEDGILTAQEVSEVNLRGTGLVVLSACETGLGEVSGEGVFGLQRGFKKAGAQTIIMSLWQVSDDATCLMMSTFFQHLLNGESKYDSFRAAQETVREEYDRNPYYWAAFIMLD